MLMPLLDVLVGLMLVYLIFSIAASGAMELAEAVLRKRGDVLRSGIAEIFRSANGPRTDAALEALVQAFYRSPHISPLFRGSYAQKRLPSYIPASRFALALMHAQAASGPQDAPLAAQLQDMAAAIVRLYGLSMAITPGEQQMLLERYFNENGERMSGWYRQHVRIVLSGIALVLCVVLNVDTVRIFTTLSGNSDLRGRLVEEALTQARAGSAMAIAVCDPAAGVDCTEHYRRELGVVLDLADSLALPIYWQTDPLLLDPPSGLWNGLIAWLGKLLGLAVSTFAISLGTPFWFGALNKLIELRTSLRPGTRAAAAARDSGAPGGTPPS